MFLEDPFQIFCLCRHLTTQVGWTTWNQLKTSEHYTPNVTCTHLYIVILLKSFGPFSFAQFSKCVALLSASGGHCKQSVGISPASVQDPLRRTWTTPLRWGLHDKQPWSSWRMWSQCGHMILNASPIWDTLKGARFPEFSLTQVRTDLHNCTPSCLCCCCNLLQMLRYFQNQLPFGSYWGDITCSWFWRPRSSKQICESLLAGLLRSLSSVQCRRSCPISQPIARATLDRPISKENQTTHETKQEKTHYN